MTSGPAEPSTPAQTLYRGRDVILIERLDAQEVSPSEFYAQYVAKGIPAVLCKALTKWEALGKWTPEFLQTAHTDVKVSVDHGASSGRQWRETSMGEYIRTYMRVPSIAREDASSDTSNGRADEVSRYADPQSKAIQDSGNWAEPSCSSSAAEEQPAASTSLRRQHKRCGACQAPTTEMHQSPAAQMTVQASSSNPSQALQRGTCSDANIARKHNPHATPDKAQDSHAAVAERELGCGREDIPAPQSNASNKNQLGAPPPYLRTFNFEHIAALVRDCPSLPHFVDHFKTLPCAAQPPFRWMFCGPPGATTPLHVDIWGTDAWLAQLYGTKQFLLYHPAQLRHLSDSAGAFPDLPRLDRQRFPDFFRATPCIVDLRPGEVIYIPRRWPHFVYGLDRTISVTVNFLPPCNIKSVRPLWERYAQRRALCEKLLKRPLRPSDNLMKFCCHGGELPIAQLKSFVLMGKHNDADSPAVDDSAVDIE